MSQWYYYLKIQEAHNQAGNKSRPLHPKTWLDNELNLNALIMLFTLPYICDLEFIGYNVVINEDDFTSAGPLYVMQR